jgi:hypothetical protein
MADSDAQNQGEVREENERFAVLRICRDLPDALLFKSILDSADIECFLVDDATVRMDWLWSNAIGGIKPCTRQADFGAASNMLEQRIQNAFSVEGPEEYVQPRCPKCRSLDISFTGLNKPLSYASILAGVPIPVPSSIWECESCGHRWSDSEKITPPESQ